MLCRIVAKINVWKTSEKCYEAIGNTKSVIYKTLAAYSLLKQKLNTIVFFNQLLNRGFVQNSFVSLKVGAGYFYSQLTKFPFVKRIIKKLKIVMK